MWFRRPDMCKVILNFRFDILKKTTDKRAPPIRPRDFFIFSTGSNNCYVLISNFFYVTVTRNFRSNWGWIHELVAAWAPVASLALHFLPNARRWPRLVSWHVINTTLEILRVAFSIRRVSRWFKLSSHFVNWKHTNALIRQCCPVSRFACRSPNLPPLFFSAAGDAAD